MGRDVRHDIITTNRHRRLVRMVWPNNRNINLEMVRDGHTEAFIEYLAAPYKAKFFEAERKARSAMLGI